MTEIPGAAILPVEQKRARKALNLLFLNVSDNIRGILTRYADASGKIPRSKDNEVQRLCGEAVQRMFVGQDGRSAFADDGVTALAPYPDMLNRAYVRVTAQVMRTNKTYMERRLPDDITRWLKTATLPRDTKVGELVAASTALGNYDPMHKFVDPNGYRLSDRIWQTSMRTRLKVDAIIADGIRNGTSAQALAKLVERFLHPERESLRTNKPYGTDGSFDAMRLTRTEITAAFGRITILAGQLNPFVKDVSWVLSPSHPRTDICDNLAQSGPYPVNDVPSYPAHPFCLCSLRLNTLPPGEVIDWLRQQMENGGGEGIPGIPPETPVNSEWMLLILLGALYYLLNQELPPEATV